MRNLVDMVSCGDYKSAKQAVKEGRVQPDNVARKQLGKVLGCIPLSSPGAELLRLMYHKNYLPSFDKTKEVVITKIEIAHLRKRTWNEKQDFIEDAPLTMEALSYLLVDVWEHRENADARAVVLKYHKLYDLNQVDWPEEKRNVMQQMAAEIVIKAAVS